MQDWRRVALVRYFDHAGSLPRSQARRLHARQLGEGLDLRLLLGPILTGQWQHHMIRGELEQAEHHAEEMRHLGKAQGNVTWKCFGLILSGVTYVWLGKFNNGREYLKNALPCWDPMFRAFWA